MSIITCPYRDRCLEYNRMYKQLMSLMNENRIMKQALREYSKYFKVPENLDLWVDEGGNKTWAEKSRKFNAIKKLILEIVNEQFSRLNTPIHYSRVWEIFRNKHPNIKLSDKGIESIGRICRMLRQEGYLTSPEQGYYMPGSKMIVKQSKLNV